MRASRSTLRRRRRCSSRRRHQCQHHRHRRGQPIRFLSAFWPIYSRGVSPRAAAAHLAGGCPRHLHPLRQGRPITLRRRESRRRWLIAPAARLCLGPMHCTRAPLALLAPACLCAANAAAARPTEISHRAHKPIIVCSSRDSRRCWLQLTVTTRVAGPFPSESARRARRAAAVRARPVERSNREVGQSRGRGERRRTTIDRLRARTRRRGCGKTAGETPPATPRHRPALSTLANRLSLTPPPTPPSCAQCDHRHGWQPEAGPRWPRGRRCG